jgi:hypothetical protein
MLLTGLPKVHRNVHADFPASAFALAPLLLAGSRVVPLKEAVVWVEVKVKGFLVVQKWCFLYGLVQKIKVIVKPSQFDSPRIHSALPCDCVSWLRWEGCQRLRGALAGMFPPPAAHSPPHARLLPRRWPSATLSTRHWWDSPGLDPHPFRPSNGKDLRWPHRACSQDEEMGKDNNVFVMGEEVGEYQG